MSNNTRASYHIAVMLHSCLIDRWKTRHKENLISRNRDEKFGSYLFSKLNVHSLHCRKMKSNLYSCATPPPSRAMLTRMLPLKSRVPDQSAESPNFRKLKPERNIPPGSQWTTYNVAYRFTLFPSLPFSLSCPNAPGIVRRKRIRVVS